MLLFAVPFHDPTETKPEYASSSKNTSSSFRRKKVFLQTTHSKLNRQKELMRRTRISKRLYHKAKVVVTS